MIGSLYIHVPFCTKKCDYCHFYVIPNQERFQKMYMEALKKEWEAKKHLIDQCVSIYFGGGTPSLLGSDKIEEILSWLPPAAEITLEANPESIASFPGINRLSIGVQSFDNALLKKLGRTHTAKEAEEAILAAEVDNISIDLMYDLPNQTLDQWEESLDRALALPIKHISLYNLTIEPHTAFYKRRKTLQLPSDETSLAMLQMAVAKTKPRFQRYELSAFAQEGFESQHNTGYWTGRPFLGLGPSACSYIEGARFRNTANFHKWARDIHAIDYHERLPKYERECELLAVGLRLIEGVETELNVDRLIEEGFVFREKEKVRLTEKGQLFHDTVAEHIMQSELPLQQR